MGEEVMDETLKQLVAFFAERMRLTEEERGRLEELLGDFVGEKAEQQADRALDREFNRGDYRS
jgi:predicted transcriptional regulator